MLKIIVATALIKKYGSFDDECINLITATFYMFPVAYTSMLTLSSGHTPDFVSHTPNFVVWPHPWLQSYCTFDFVD